MNLRSSQLRPSRTLARILSSVVLVVSLVTTSGCATLPNAPLSSPSLETAEESQDTEEASAPKTFAERQAKWRKFFNSPFGESAGLDPRAREIERRLGY